MEALARQIAASESETLDRKRSTAQIGCAVQTPCTFLNAGGGRVFLSVAVVGQDDSDKTHRDNAAMLDRFAPPAPVEVDLVEVPDSDQKLIVLGAHPDGETRQERR